MEIAEKIVKKAKEIVLPEREKQILTEFLTHAERQIDPITRRVIKKEVIYHEKKIFSIFEPHTEWISDDYIYPLEVKSGNSSKKKNLRVYGHVSSGDAYSQLSHEFKKG